MVIMSTAAGTSRRRERALAARFSKAQSPPTSASSRAFRTSQTVFTMNSMRRLMSCNSELVDPLQPRKRTTPCEGCCDYSTGTTDCKVIHRCPQSPSQPCRHLWVLDVIRARSPRSAARGSTCGLFAQSSAFVLRSVSVAKSPFLCQRTDGTIKQRSRRASSSCKKRP